MPESKLQVGDPAPRFEMTSDTGEAVRLSDFRGKRVILYFYPKDDTSGCTTQACGFRDEYPNVLKRNAIVLGVSPDGVKSHQKFKAKHDLPFALLVDEDHKIAERYGVWGEKSMYGRKYMGVARSHFVIEKDGRLIDIQIKVSPSDSVEKALQAI